MEELKENNAPRDRAILVGLSSPRLDRKENADEESLEELGALVETAGGVSVGVVLQTLPSPNPHTFIGEGKVDEIRELVKSQEATMVIFDNDLSPSQMRVLCEEFGVQVLDRSGLILDIFAQRAKTKEGRLQVELAQYQYLGARRATAAYSAYSSWRPFSSDSISTKCLNTLARGSLREYTAWPMP